MTTIVLRDDQSSPAMSGLSDRLQSTRYSKQQEHQRERQMHKSKMEIMLPKTVKQLLNEEQEEIHKQNLHESRCPHPKWNCCTGWPCTSTAPGTSHWTPLSTSPSGRLSHHGDDLMKTKHRKTTEWISIWGAGGEKIHLQLWWSWVFVTLLEKH